jgi:hypothetical protein
MYSAHYQSSSQNGMIVDYKAYARDGRPGILLLS